MKKNLCVAVLFICLSLVCLSATSFSAQAGASQMSVDAAKAAIRANDIADCNNLMGSHVWYHASFLNNIEIEKCWVKTPEYAKTAVWAQNSNYWISLDNIKAYYGVPTAHEKTKGGFQFHATTSGVVEIAEDRKTAKGVWYTNGGVGTGQNVQGMWERYGIDFVNENGVWKIWHLHVYTDFAYSLKSGSGGGFGGGMGAPSAGMSGPSGGAPSGMPGGGQGSPAGASPSGTAAPQAAAGKGITEKAEKIGPESGGGMTFPMVQSQATANPGYQELGDNSYADLIPRPPEPYKTFSDTWSYGDPDEVKMFSGGYREWSEIKTKYKK